MKPIELPTDKIALEKGYIYSEAEANKIIAFAHKYFISEFARPPFRLLEFQERYLRTLYGWIHKTTGFRRFNSSIITMAKKK